MARSRKAVGVGYAVDARGKSEDQCNCRDLEQLSGYLEICQKKQGSHTAWMSHP